MMKRLLLALAPLLLLAGCGDARETSLLSPVSAAAVSQTDGGLRLTAETVFQDGAEGSASPEYLAAEGQTLPETFTKLASSVGGEIYWGHAQALIVDERTAREGMLPLCEYLLSDGEARLALRLTVARDAGAEAVLRAWAPNGEIPGFALGRMLSQGEKRGTGMDMPLYRFYNALRAGEPVRLPAVAIGPDGQAVPDGAAQFSHGVLTGFTGGDHDA